MVGNTWSPFIFGPDVGRDGTILKVDNEGNPEFAKIVGLDTIIPIGSPYLTKDVDEVLRGLVVLPDSGFVVMCPKRYRSVPSAIDIDAPFLARFDKHGNVVWAKDFMQATWLYTLNLTPDGNIIVSGQYDQLNYEKSIIAELDLSGNVQWAKTYTDGNGHIFFSALSFTPSGDIAVEGRTSFPEKDSLVLFRLSPEGDFDFGKKYAYQSSGNKTFGVARSLLPIADGYLLGSGIQERESPYSFEWATILKTDLSGNLLWAKSYQDTLYGITDFVNGLLESPGGQVWVSFSDIYHFSNDHQLPPSWFNEDSAPSLAIIDSEGEIVWNKDYGAFGEASTVRFLSDSTVLLSGRSSYGGMGLMKLDAQDRENCHDIPLDILVEDISVGVAGFVMAVETVPVDMVDFYLPVKDAQISTYNLCCDSLPDMDIFSLSLAYSCPDHNLVSSIQVCNNGTAPWPRDSLLVGVYDKDPFSQAANLLDTFRLGNLPSSLLGPGTHCRHFFNIRVPASPTGELFFLLNPPLGSATPIDPNCGYTGMEVEECGYFNNRDSIRVAPYDTVLDLGPDTTICPDSEPILLVEDFNDYQSFLWNDGGTDSALLVQDTGQYWVEAVDRCGILHSDSIHFGYYEVPQFDFGVDTVFGGCNDDTVYLSMPQGFESYNWYDNVAGPGTDAYIFCDTCAETGVLTKFSPDLGHRFYGIATTAEGCESKAEITFFVNLTYTWMPPQRDTFACAGGNIELGGIEYPADTTVTVTLQTVHGCDSLVIYTIHPRDTFYIELDTTACEGGALSIGGQSVPAGSQQAVVYNSQQGCDSTVLYRVAPLPLSESMADTVICPGTSVLVFGSEESGPGTYTDNFTAANGCDSLHYFSISLFEETAVEISTTPTCEGKQEGTAAAQVSGGTAPYQLQWSNGTQDSTALSSLPAGSYGLTVTDANGCGQSLAFGIADYPPSEAPARCEPRLYAPTAFSPNGDGVNDHFILYSNNKVLEIIYLQIYDRWGEMVFEGKHLPPGIEASGWDGRLDGKFLNPGVFAWKALVRYESREERALRGHVVLLR